MSEPLSDRSTAGPESFWNATNATSEPLTEETLIAGMKKMREKMDWEYQHPHGVSPENPHIVSSKTKARLEREAAAGAPGGYAMCGTCGPCYIHFTSRTTREEG